MDQVAEQIDGFGPTSAFLAAEVDANGVCQSIAAVRPELALPIGSVFKLYVLGAVATAIDEETLTWDQPVVIHDELDSLPSGITHDEPAGSTLTVEELARRMIAISDDAATDHLIDLVGRDRVEAALSVFGHSDQPHPLLRARRAVIGVRLGDRSRCRARTAARSLVRNATMAGGAVALRLATGPLR